MFLPFWLVLLAMSLGLIFSYMVEAFCGGNSEMATKKTISIAEAGLTSPFFLTLAGFLIAGAIFSETWESPLVCFLGYVAALGLAFVAGCFSCLSNEAVVVGDSAVSASAQCKVLEAQVGNLKKTLHETETRCDGLVLANNELRRSLDVQAITIKKQYDSMSAEYFRLVEENERLKDMLQPQKSFASKKDD